MDAWVGVVGVLGGVAITSVFGLITARLTHAWQREARVEDRRSVRGDLRRAAYATFLVQTQKAIDETTKWMAGTGCGMRSLADRVEAYARDLGDCTHDRDSSERHAKLVAGPSVRVELELYDAWFRPAVGQVIAQLPPGFAGADGHERQLIDAMIRELDDDMVIPDGQKSARWQVWRLRGH